MSPETGRVTISRFSSDTDAQKQILKETVLQTRWLPAIDIPFSSSKTIEVTVGSRRIPIFIVSGQPDTKQAFRRRFA